MGAVSGRASFSSGSGPRHRYTHPTSPLAISSLCTHFVPAPAEAAQSLGRTAAALTRTYYGLRVGARPALTRPISDQCHRSGSRPWRLRTRDAAAPEPCRATRGLTRGLLPACIRAALRRWLPTPRPPAVVATEGGAGTGMARRGVPRRIGDIRYPTLKPRLLIACAVHVCESKQSIEVRKNRIATSVCAA